MGQLSLILAIAVALFQATGCSGPNEKEPNDSLDKAARFSLTENDAQLFKTGFVLPPALAEKWPQERLYELEHNKALLLPGRSLKIHGAFQNKKDRDCYSIAMPPGYWQAQLSAIKGINGALEIYTDSSTPSKVIDDYRKSDKETTGLFPVSDSGARLCVIQGKRDPHKGAPDRLYHLSVTHYDANIPSPLTVEQEPNDTQAQAEPIQTDSHILGSYSPTLNRQNDKEDNHLREEDWFYLRNDQSDTPLYFRLHVTGVKGADPVITVYRSTDDKKSQKLFLFDNNSLNQHENSPTLRLMPDEGYYIRLHSKVVHNLPKRLYLFSVKTSDSGRPTESEPNNNLSEANELKDNPISIKGTISHKDDQDYFRLPELKHAVSLALELKVPQSLQSLQLKLLDNNEKTIWQGKGEQKISIAGIYLPQDTYYLLVNNKYGHFSMENPYTLNLIMEAQKRYGEREPNDDKENANDFLWSQGSLHLGPGYIAPPKDKDYYQIDIQGQRRQRFRFSVTAAPEQKLQISITDPQGYILKKAVKNPNQKLSFAETIDGKAYIIVELLDGRMSIQNPYFIKLSPK